MPRVVHFEIHADQPERAAAFHTALLGWRFQKWTGRTDYWLVTTGPDGEPGINGGMGRRRPGRRGDAVVVPKMPVPGVGWLAHCKDTEGNLFGAMQPEPAAG